jgi:hypothetical protein
MTRLPLLLLALAAIAGSAPHALAATMIPFVGCIEQGPTPNDGSWTAPSGKPMVTDLDPAIAGKLAVYASNWSAVLAPRGWACRSAVIEQQGVAMIVTPEPAEGDDRGILEGPAIILWNDQSPATVAAYATRYFPAAIATIKADADYCSHTCSMLLDPKQKGFTEAPKFPSDMIRYESRFVLAYTTPANHHGLGNQIGTPAPGQSSLAAFGLLGLSKLPQGEGGVVNLTVRLPVAMTPLKGAILKVFTACLPNNNTVSCESGDSFTGQGRPIDDGD